MPYGEVEGAKVPLESASVREDVKVALVEVRESLREPGNLA